MAVRFTAGSLDRVRVWNGAVETWYDANGTVLSDWAHVGLGAQAIGRIDDQTDFELSFHNGLQHFMGSIDFDTGAVETAFIYGPYGEVIKESSSADTAMHLRRFNGKEDDQLSKLSYYGYRYYDSQSLTWTSADPKYLLEPDLAGADPRRASLYAFTKNNPLRYLDPDGQDSVIISGEETPEPSKPVEDMTEEEKAQWAEILAHAKKFNKQKLADSEALKAEFVASGMKEEEIFVTTLGGLEGVVERIEANGHSVSAAVGLGHGGLPGNSSMNLEGALGGTKGLGELIEKAGVVEGGAFVAWGCSTISKKDMSGIGSSGRAVSGTTSPTRSSQGGTLYKGRRSSFGDAVPDIGTHVGPYRRDTGKSIKQTVVDTIYVLEGPGSFRPLR